MYCHNCGKEVVEGAIYCSFCGAKLISEGAQGEAEATGARVKPLTSLPNVLYLVLLIFAPISLHFGLTGSSGVRLAMETIGLTAPALIAVVIYNYLQGENEKVKRISSGISLLLLAVVLLSIVGSIAKTRKAGPAAPETSYQTEQQMQQPQQMQAGIPSAGQGVINVNIAVAGSAVIDVPETMERVQLADPDIADIKLTTPTKIEVTGKSKGVTNLNVLDKSGQTMLFTITVN